MALTTACSDYLEVDAPSKYTNEFIYTSSSEASTALNGVYANTLRNETFGRYLYDDLLLNSDVDFKANSNETSQINAPVRFDCTANAGTVEGVWNALYAGIESANEFIYNMENSPIYNEENTDYADLTQMVGEAKVMRAMFYYELLCYFGDIPFSMEPTYVTQNFVLPMTSRDEVYKQIIDDLKGAALKMKTTGSISEGVERISKEACWAMIARMSLQAGGYSLRAPEGDTRSYGTMQRPANSREFYQTARDYADSVIVSGTHALTKSYKQVFIDECNFIVTNTDDPIFEIPFAQNSTGQWGYRQGATAQSSEGVTPHVYGEVNGGVRTEAFYRYTFDEKDLRRDYISGMWYYASTGLPTIRQDYNYHNNKWSKLWNTIGLGNQTTGSTGINFAYLRYADVLLMFAEAENELNGPTEDAQEALKTVRRRAFATEDWAEKVDNYVAQAASDKETFLNTVLNERKWEFAGENMRWKDLVRNNKYAETLFFTFLRYYSVAENSSASAQYMDLVEEHDGIMWSDDKVLPTTINSCIIKNPGDKSLYDNTELYIRYIIPGTKPQVAPANYMKNEGLPYTAVSPREVTGLASSTSEIAWDETTVYEKWWNDNEGCPSAQVLYSLYGYIRGTGTGGDFGVVRDGRVEPINPNGYDIKNLPAVRYILPIPSEAIARAAGAYTQKYGY